MRDPWCSTLALLTGTAAAPPAVCWPRERTRIVVLARDEPEQPDDREAALSPADLEVLRLLARGTMSAGDLATRLQLELGAIYARCSRMKARGLISCSGRRGLWHAVGNAALTRQIDAGGAIVDTAVA